MRYKWKLTWIVKSLISCVTLGGSFGCCNQARVVPYTKRQSSQCAHCISVWPCFHPQIILGFPDNFHLFSRLAKEMKISSQEDWISADLIWGWFHGSSFSFYIWNSRNLFSFKKTWSREIFLVKHHGEEVNYKLWERVALLLCGRLLSAG